MTVARYLRPTTWEDALHALQQPGAAPVGGATDLVPLLHEGIVTPDTLVDLGAIAHADAIVEDSDGDIMLGAAVTLDTLATDPRITDRLPLLARAAAAVGSPAIRAVGTLGGNLCQHVRCWYYRGGHDCLRRGGSQCSAEVGEHQYHAIFRQGGCVVVHPSDLAVALVALDATIHLRTATAARSVAAADFLLPSRQRLDHTTCLVAGEVVDRIVVPALSTGGRQYFFKQLQRAAWDFALVSVAGTRRSDGAVRLVLGGVANTPWRVIGSVEEDVASGGLSEDDIETLAQRALYDASPLEGTAYKMDIAAALLRRAITALSRNDE